MKIRNVIFDLDGTLVDSADGVEHSIHAAVETVLPERKCPAVAAFIGPPIKQIFTQMLGELDEATLAALERAFRASYDEDGCRLTKAYPGVLETLARLCATGVHCFVATNKPSRPTQNVLAQLEMQQFFEDVITPDAETPRFASKDEMVMHLAVKHDLTRAASMVVGDSADDRHAAETNSMAFAAVVYGYGRPLAFAKNQDCAILSEPTDLPGVLGDFAFTSNMEKEWTSWPHLADPPTNDEAESEFPFDGGFILRKSA